MPCCNRGLRLIVLLVVSVPFSATAVYPGFGYLRMHVSRSWELRKIGPPFARNVKRWRFYRKRSAEKSSQLIHFTLTAVVMVLSKYGKGNHFSVLKKTFSRGFILFSGYVLFVINVEVHAAHCLMAKTRIIYTENSVGYTLSRIGT